MTFKEAQFCVKVALAFDRNIIRLYDNEDMPIHFLRIWERRMSREVQRHYPSIMEYFNYVNSSNNLKIS